MNRTPTRRLALSTAAGLLVGLAAAPVVLAQEVPPVRWELVGTEESEVYSRDVEGIAFREGAAPDGSLDTLHSVTIGSGVSRFAPGADDWEQTCDQARCNADYMEATKEGYLLIGSTAGASSGGGRSTDGGFTWEYDIIDYGISVLFQSTLPALGGAVYAGNANSVSWSYDGGATGSWTLGDPMGGQPVALAEAVPSESLPEGRLLGGAWNGAAYSADGGQTWEVVADAENGWGGFAVNVFRVGRDGRLYVGTDRGVWRTTEPVPVSEEEEPEPGKSAAELEVYPNPSSGSVTVAVSLPALKAVRVEVVDVLGREVAVLHEGRLGAGTTPLTFRVPGLPGGVYLVRVTGDGVARTERITLLR